MPFKDGYNVVITGVCMEQVTAEFPNYELSDVEKNIYNRCDQEGGIKLPRLAN